MYSQQIVRANNKVWRIEEADSFGDVLSHIENTKRIWHHDGGSEDKSHSYSDNMPWHGTENFKQAMDLAKYGWSEGRNQLKDGLDVANVLRKSKAHKSEGLDVAGAYPLVPAAVAGDPMCMFTVGQDVIKTKPVVRIIVNSFVSAGISHKVIMNRGAAILSWVDALEAMSVRCEIYVSCIGGANNSSGLGPDYVSLGCYAKRAEEVVDLDRLAFVLVHPAFFRRIQFAVMERAPDMGRRYNHYCMPCDLIPPTMDIPHSVYFTCAGLNNADYQSPATAVAAVERAIMKSLQQSEVEDDLKSMEDW